MEDGMKHLWEVDHAYYTHYYDKPLYAKEQQ